MARRRRSAPAVRRDRRLPDWEQRLGAYLESVSDRPHAYGEHDCLLFCSGIVQAVTGVDLSRGRRGRYRDSIGAARHLRQLGFRSAAELIGSLLPERPVGFARRGDLVLGEDGIPGVCLGGTAAFVTEAGLASSPRPEWAKAWSVGEA